MNKVILDQLTLARFLELTEGAEVCDQDGNIVGFFTPAVDRSLYSGADSPIDDEQLRRRAERGCGRTLSEIMADLERHA